MEKITLTVKELAQTTGISMPTAYEWVHTEGFPVVKVGRKLLIPVHDLELWLSERAHASKE